MERTRCARAGVRSVGMKLIVAVLVQVPLAMLPHLTKAGFWPAPDELQAAQPPQGPVRGVNASPGERPVLWSAPL